MIIYVIGQEVNFYNLTAKFLFAYLLYMLVNN